MAIRVATGRALYALRGGTLTRIDADATPPSAYPMSDAFTGAFDTTKWPASVNGPTNVAGQLQLMPAVASPSAISGYIFNPTLYRVQVELVQRPTTGTNGATRFLLQVSGGQQVGFQLGSTNLSMICSALTTVNVTYNNATHRWLGISLTGGNFVLDTSPDKVTWTTRATFAAPAWASALMRTALTATTSDAPYTGTPAIFDNFNV